MYAIGSFMDTDVFMNHDYTYVTNFAWLRFKTQ